MYIFKNKVVFFENISFFEVKDEMIYLSFRKVIKTEKINTSMSNSEFSKILKDEKISYIKKVGPYYINLNKIIYFEENLDKELTKPDRIWIRFVFEIDYLDIEVTKEFWNFWKQTNNIKL